MRSGKNHLLNVPSFGNGLGKIIFDTNPLPMWVFDRQTFQFLAVNEKAVLRYGYTRAEFLGMKASDIRPADDVPSFMESVAAIDSTSLESKGEWKHRVKSGELIDVEVLVSIVEFDGREAVLGALHDVTERNRAEAALRQSEAKYRELIESMPLGHYLSTSGGRFVEVNSAFCKMLGYTREELLAMNIPEELYFASEEREGESRYVGFSAVTEVYRLKKKDGTELWVDDYARYIRDDAGTIIYHEGLCQDVTEKKRTQDALQFNETRLRTIIENSSDTIILIDLEWNLIECLNPTSYERITGYSVAERAGKSGIDLIHPDDLQPIKNKFPLTGLQDEVVRSEFRIRRKDGSWRWVEGAMRNMVDDPSIKAVVIGIRDIEERKAAEKLLVESEERYRLLLDNSPDSIVVLTEGRFAYVNPATLGPVHAQSFDQLVGKRFLDFVHPDSREVTADRIREMLKSQKPVALQEMRLVGLDGSEIEVEVRSAPVMYLGKPSIQSVIRNITSRRQVEKQLHLQSAALNTAANAIVITDTSGSIVWANPAFRSLTGYSLDESMGHNLRTLIKSGKQDREFYRNLWETIVAGRVWRGEIVNRKKDGSLYTEAMTIAPVREGSGEITHFIAVKQDITDQKSLQEQLLQSQKLESIGQLAGGVAHDYNNILGVIIGYAELLKSNLEYNFEAQRSVDAILTASTRAADLTRQLLAFARKDIISPKVINLDSVVESIQKMLRRIVGENIALIFHPIENLWNVRMDPSQLDQVLINLVANSRDAIQGIGTIIIETGNVTVDGDIAKTRAGLNAGDFVRLSFSDTGTGMEEETAKRIFEPFFTTKKAGHGTGLGLSTVYGIIKQNNGNIYVTSKPGMGTTFEIFLPRFDGRAEGIPEKWPERIGLGSETILVVEDQPDMLELAKVSLENYGYRVLTAKGPSEAISLSRSYPDTVHLLLTDVIMPVMSGRDLSERIKAARPEIRILFMSGYTANELDPEGVVGNEVDFIQKPFTPSGLAKKVREVLKG